MHGSRLEAEARAAPYLKAFAPKMQRNAAGKHIAELLPLMGIVLPRFAARQKADEYRLKRVFLRVGDKPVYGMAGLLIFLYKNIVRAENDLLLSRAFAEKISQAHTQRFQYIGKCSD